MGTGRGRGGGGGEGKLCRVARVAYAPCEYRVEAALVIVTSVHNFYCIIQYHSCSYDILILSADRRRLLPFSSMD